MKATIQSLAVLGCAAAISVGSLAHAQANPELGDTGAGTWAPPAADGEASASASTSGDVSADGSFGSDGGSSDSSPSSSPSGDGAHADMVGRFGIGFFGVTDLPICLDGGCDNGAVSAPALGLRYWLDETLGIEGALGFGSTGGTQTIEGNGGMDENLDADTLGILLHGAVPVALAFSDNFVFEVIPEMDIGFATGTIYDNNTAPGMNPQDTDISGFLFRLGGRAGAEIHFGFIGIPQLSLQGTVGLHFSYTSRSSSLAGLDVSHSRTNIGTSVQESPWNIFTGNIAAIYYL